MDAVPHVSPPPLSKLTPLRPTPVSLPPPTVWQALGLLVLYFLLQWVIGSVVSLSMGWIAQLQHPHSSAAARAALTTGDSTVLLVIITLACDAAIMLALVRRLWPSLWSQARPPGLAFRQATHPAYYAVAALIGLGVPVVGGLLTHWLAQGHAVPQDIQQLGGGASPALRIPLAILVVSVGPLVEELLFRGLLLGSLISADAYPASSPAVTTPTWLSRWATPTTRTWLAIVISGLLFGLVHLPDLGYLWFAVPNLAMLGIALAWLRLRAQSLWPCVLAHGLNNLLAVLAWFAISPVGH